MDGTTTIKIDYYEELKANSDKWVEKETPYKPTKQEFFKYLGNVGKCKCKSEVTSKEKYCDECGQKLDWSNV